MASIREILRALPVERRKAFLREQLERRARRNPLGFVRAPDGTPRPRTWFEKQQAAWELWDDPRRKVVAMIGANRMGKTAWALGVLAEVLLGIPRAQWGDLDPDPRRWPLGPPKTAWCVTVSFEKSVTNQQQGVWNTLPRELCDAVWHKRSGFVGKLLELPNGSQVRFKSCEQDIRTFESDAIDFAWIDETIPESYFLALLPRLTDRAGRLVWTTIPDDPFLDDLFFTRTLRPDQDVPFDEHSLAVVSGTMRDNPLLSEQQIRFLEATMGPEEVLFRVAGKFARKSGLVYADYTPDLHDEKLEPPLPADWAANRIESIDPGWANPCGVAFLALDRENALHVYDEVYEKQRTVGEIAALVFLKRWQWAGRIAPDEATRLEQVAGLGGRPPETTEGALARDREIAALLRAYGQAKGELAPRLTLADEYGTHATQSGPVSFIRQLAEFGIRAEPASNRDKDGQRARVRELLRPRDGLLRLRVNARCQWLRWELRHHRYEAPDERLRQYKGDRERVLLGDDHLINCIEYAAAADPTFRPLEAGPAPANTILGRHQRALAAQERGDWRRRG